MMVPTIHLNGTSKDALLDDVVEATKALSAAIRTVGNAAPNGRDYYPQGPDAIAQATKEHVARLAKLSAVHDELMDLYYAIDEQGGAR